MCPWYDLRESISKIVIADGVTHIGDSAFQFDFLFEHNPIEVIIGKGVESIGEWSFYAINTETINIPSKVTIIGSNAFAYSKVKTVTLPEGLESVGSGAFWRANLEKINIPSSLKYIGSSAFESTPWLENVKDEKGNFIVNDILLAFGETNQETITIPNGVTSIQCGISLSNVKKIIFPESLTYIGDYAFDCCGELESLELPSQLEYIGDEAFIGCSKIKNVYIPAKVQHIGAGVFAGCQIGGYSSIEKYVVDSNNAFFHTIDNGNAIVETATKTLICGTKNTKISEDIEAIGPEAFFWTDITQIEFPSTLTTIGERAFYNSGLQEVVLPDNIKEIGKFAFEWCEELQKVQLPKGMTKIEQAVFAYCPKLTSIEFPDSLTHIGPGAFFCTGLEEVKCPNGLTDIGEEAFYRCEKLKSIVLSDKVTSIGESAFEGCESIESIIIPDSVTYIGEYAFHNCTSLESITIPDSVVSIGAYAFEDIIYEEIDGEEVFKFRFVINCTKDSYAYQYAKENGIDVNIICQHTNTELRNTKNATCKEDGYTGDTYCKDCDTLLSSGTAIAKAEHTWDAGVITTQATVSAEGVKTYTCTACGETRTESIPKLAETPVQSSITNGSQVAVSGVTYTVTDVDKATVIYTSNINKNANSVTIPATVEIEGKEYKVTKIADNALKNNKKVKKITVGKNVTSIGKNAFKNCTKLKTVDIKSTTLNKIGSNAFSGAKKLTKITIKSTKLTKNSIGKNALKGTNKKLVVKVPKKMVKKYKTYFKNKGNKTVNVKK